MPYSMEQIKADPSLVTEEVCAHPEVAAFERFQGWSDLSEVVIEWLDEGRFWRPAWAELRYDFDQGKAAELGRCLRRLFPHYEGVFGRL